MENVVDFPPPAIEQSTEPKLYSFNMINLATFLGGPLAGGWLLRSNLLALRKEKEALYTIILSLVISGAIIGVIVFTPEDVLNKIPNFVFPAIYTGIFVGLTQKFMGKELKAYRVRKGPYHSKWKAAGFGLAFGAIFLVAVVGLLTLNDPFDADRYNSLIEKFAESETKALQLYEKSSEPMYVQASFIEITGIPKWKECIQHLQDARALPNVPADVLKINLKLEHYCSLRLEMYQLHHKAIQENTVNYDARIEELTRDIETILEELE